ncbi:signal peptidase I [Kitasatospora cineracea]|uniref:signal peptidase I n=1 Tax=Kitasatospora cineracea TaxID=88074 RepID=UPI001FC9E41B|nr:signal peptidase I [Kitasatospora cineracea]
MFGPSRTRTVLGCVAVALLLSLLIKTFLVQVFVIPSGSMMGTLQKDDRVAVDKFSPWLGERPHRGEVVVFEDPGGWLTGPTGSGGVLQGVLSHLGLMPAAPVGTVKVPAGFLWVMGDHRNDSRYQQLHNPAGGFVPVDDVIGRARVLLWPADRWTTLPVPDTFTHLG